MSVYALYRDEDGFIAKVFQTRAEADAAVLPGTSVGELPDEGEPGRYRRVGTNGEAYLSDTPETASVILAFRALHKAGLDLQAAISTLEASYPVAVINALKDLFVKVRRASYNVSRSTSMTVAQKLAWVNQMTLGPTDAPVSGDLTAAVRDAAKLIEGGAIIPSGPCAWVNSAGQRTALGSMASFSGTVPASVDLGDPSHYDDMPTT